MTITVLPSADGEEMLGQLETNLLWGAQDSIVHEGNGKCSWVEDMSSFKGTKALRPQMLTARESASKGQSSSSRGGYVRNGSCGRLLDIATLQTPFLACWCTCKCDTSHVTAKILTPRTGAI